MKRRSILAFDCARNTGWAFLPAEAYDRWPRVPMAWSNQGAPSELKSGVVTLAGDTGHNRASLLLSATEKYGDLITFFRPDFIAFEAPLNRQVKGFSAVIMAIDTSGTVVRLAAERQIMVGRMNPQDIKKYWTGNGNAPKEKMVETAKARGLTVADDNEADAIALINATILTFENARARA